MNSNNGTFGSNTILVISDRREQFARAASRLRGEGYQVRFEKDPEESLRFARTEFPRLIITELAVPDIDGLSFCINMRGKKDFDATPILLVGDLSRESSIVSDGLRCGANDYLQKPFDDTKFLKLCREMANRGERPVESPDENLFDAMVANISDSILIIDTEGQVFFESESSKRILQYDGTELIGKCFLNFVHPEDAAEVLHYFDSVKRGATAIDPVVYRIRKNNVSWSLVESIGRPINDARFGSAIVVTSRQKVSSDFGKEKNSGEFGSPFAHPLTVGNKVMQFADWEIDERLMSQN